MASSPERSSARATVVLPAPSAPMRATVTTSGTCSREPRSWCELGRDPCWERRRHVEPLAGRSRLDRPSVEPAHPLNEPDGTLVTSSGRGRAYGALRHSRGSVPIAGRDPRKAPRPSDVEVAALPRRPGRRNPFPAAARLALAELDPRGAPRRRPPDLLPQVRTDVA